MTISYGLIEDIFIFHSQNIGSELEVSSTFFYGGKCYNNYIFRYHMLLYVQWISINRRKTSVRKPRKLSTFLWHGSFCPRSYRSCKLCWFFFTIFMIISNSLLSSAAVVLKTVRFTPYEAKSIFRDLYETIY